MSSNFPTGRKLTEEAHIKTAVTFDQTKQEAEEDYIFEQPISQSETSDFLARSLHEMKDELHKIPDEEKEGYREAHECRAEYAYETDDLVLFLRKEKFNAKAAARGIVTYWKNRIELFGRDRCFNPLSVHNSLEDNENDAYALSMATFCLLPGKDNFGRSIIFNSAGSKNIDYKQESMLRVLWCVCHGALRAVNSKERTRGDIVMVCTARRTQLDNFDHKFQNTSLTAMKDIIPIKIVKTHLCNPSMTLTYTLPVLHQLMGPELRQRCQVHEGKDEQVIEALSSFGVPKSVLPSEIGGDVILSDDVDGSIDLTNKVEKRKAKYNYDEIKRQKRLESNRKSAAACRQRRLDLIEELKNSVVELTSTVNSLTKENTELRQQLQLQTRSSQKNTPQLTRGELDADCTPSVSQRMHSGRLLTHVTHHDNRDPVVGMLSAADSVPIEALSSPLQLHVGGNQRTTHILSPSLLTEEHRILDRPVSLGQQPYIRHFSVPSLLASPSVTFQEAPGGQAQHVVLATHAFGREVAHGQIRINSHQIGDTLRDLQQSAQLRNASIPQGSSSLYFSSNGERDQKRKER